MAFRHWTELPWCIGDHLDSWLRFSNYWLLWHSSLACLSAEWFPMMVGNWKLESGLHTFCLLCAITTIQLLIIPSISYHILVLFCHTKRVVVYPLSSVFNFLFENKIDYLMKTLIFIAATWKILFLIFLSESKLPLKIFALLYVVLWVWNAYWSVM